MKYLNLIIILLSILLCSCGWQVRGTALNTVLELSLLEYAAAVSPGLSRTLDRAFVPTSSDEGPEYLLTIVQEMQIERIQSLTESLHTGQLRMEKRVQYRISALNGGRVETGTALVWRDLDEDEFNPGATEREKTFLQNEIDADIVQQILRHLERFSINNAGDISARQNATQG